MYKDYKKSLELCEEALRIDPEFPSGYFLKIENYYHLGLLKEAEEKYIKLVESNPGNTIYRMALGTCYFHREKFKKAKEMFQSVIDLHKKGILSENIYAAYISLARACAYSGEIKEAVTCIKIPLIEESYCGELYFELGKLYIKTGAKDKARQTFERVSRLVPNTVMGFCARAYNYLEEDNIKKVLEELMEAKKKSYNSDKVHYLLGVIEEKKGNTKKAMRYYRQTLEFNHLHMEAREALLRLKED